MQQPSKFSEAKVHRPNFHSAPPMACDHQGDKIATVYGSCSGTVDVHECKLLGGPCWKAPCSKDWSTIRCEPPLETEPRTCFGCEHNTSSQRRWIAGQIAEPIYLGKESIPDPQSEKAVLVIAPDDRTKRQLQITRARFAAYAKTFGADLVILEDNRYPQWPMANKWRATTIAARYEQTLYLDADVVISRESPNVFDFVPVGSWGLFDELPDVNQINIEGYASELAEACSDALLPVPGFVPNAGVLVMPRNARAYLPPRKKWKVNWCYDQYLLAARLVARKESIEFLDWRWNHGFIKPTWERDIPGAFFVHTNGCEPLELRLEKLAWLNGLLP